jgi:membrane protein
MVGSMWRRVTQFIKDIRLAVQRWSADDGAAMAAATAYYVGLSFFPLLLVLIAGVGWFLENTHLGQNAEQQVVNAIDHNLSPQLAEYVAQSLSLVRERSIISGPLGLATMVLTSLAAFAQLDSAFDRIWATPKKHESHGILRYAIELLQQRGRAFLLLFALGIVVLMVFFAGMILAAVESHTERIVALWGRFWDVVQFAVTMSINASIFTVLYRFLPRVGIRWSEAFHGGLLTAVAWEIGRQLLAVYVARSKYTSAYGVVGAFLAILLWCYYVVAIVLLGAEYVAVLRARRRKRMKESRSDSVAQDRHAG